MLQKEANYNFCKNRREDQCSLKDKDNEINGTLIERKSVMKATTFRNRYFLGEIACLSCMKVTRVHRVKNESV